MPHHEHLEELARIVRHHNALGTPLDMGCFWSVCGTHGCIAGWAAQDDYFRDLGLAVMPAKVGGNRHGVLVLWQRKGGQPHALQAFDALEHLFELDAYQAAYIFGDNPIITGAETITCWGDALSRIQEVLRGDV